jgi:hypothetical protein
VLVDLGVLEPTDGGYTVDSDSEVYRRAAAFGTAVRRRRE